MTVTSGNDVAITTSWVDITVARPELANADIFLENKVSGAAVYLVWGGAAPVAGSVKGQQLGYLQTVKGKAAAVWLRTEASAGGLVAAGVIT